MSYCFDTQFELELDGRIEEPLCSDCPPSDYPTDKTRCDVCPRHSGLHLETDPASAGQAPAGKPENEGLEGSDGK